jgi:hypothetical protein
MCSVNFTLLIFLLRIGPRGTYFLAGAFAMAFIAWRILASLGFSVEFVFHHHSGMLVLVIQLLLSFAMFCVVMSFLACLVIKM